MYAYVWRTKWIGHSGMIEWCQQWSNLGIASSILQGNIIHYLHYQWRWSLPAGFTTYFCLFHNYSRALRKRARWKTTKKRSNWFKPPSSVLHKQEKHHVTLSIAVFLKIFYEGPHCPTQFSTIFLPVFLL